MADNGVKIIKLMHFFHLVSYLLLCASVQGRKISTQNTLKHKNALKTIRTKNGDIVDCVSLYKQPSLNHPLLKNHKIQMQPQGYHKRMKNNALESENHEINAQLEIVQCPEGTIPILRTPKSVSQSNHDAAPLLYNSISVGNQIASFWLKGKGKGIHSSESYINVWNPKLKDPKDFSGVFMWVQSSDQEQPGNVNVAGAGWMVGPGTYGDNRTRLTTFWTKDQRMCINLNCRGFVQTNNSIGLGLELRPSVYGDKNSQEDIRLIIKRDYGSGKWWMSYQGYWVGYWPKEIFSETGLRYPAEYAAWGGQVLNSGHFPGQTTTEMGSGHFPSEGYGKACYIRNLNAGPIIPRVENLQPQITNAMCYDAALDHDKEFGTYIYLGGNGGSNPNCR